MATRSTMQAAEELKAQFEGWYPGAEIRIVDRSQPTYSQFAVLEVVKCRDCGGEILTQAIGELGNDRCHSCREAGHSNWTRKTQESTRRESQRVADNLARDLWEE